MLKKQLIGGAGALAALLTLLALWTIRRHFASWIPAGDDTAARLAFAADWLLLPGLALLIGVQGAARRGFYRDAIDGTRTPSNAALEINLRYNQNTVEQTVLAAIAWMGLALHLPHDWLWAIPAAAWLFFFGRIAFFVGYLVYPIARAYGMTLTVLPTLIAYVWLVWRLLLVR